MKKILIIDDEIEICNVIKKVFQNKNFKVMYSLKGKDGLKIFYSEKPEIIILDLNLNDMSGFEILKKIKNHNPSCYVLMITASRFKDIKNQEPFIPLFVELAKECVNSGYGENKPILVYTDNMDTPLEEQKFLKQFTPEKLDVLMYYCYLEM